MFFQNVKFNFCTLFDKEGAKLEEEGEFVEFADPQCEIESVDSSLTLNPSEEGKASFTSRMIALFNKIANMTASQLEAVYKWLKATFYDPVRKVYVFAKIMVYLSAGGEADINRAIAEFGWEALLHYVGELAKLIVEFDPGDAISKWYHSVKSMVNNSVRKIGSAVAKYDTDFYEATLVRPTSVVLDLGLTVLATAIAKTPIASLITLGASPLFALTAVKLLLDLALILLYRKFKPRISYQLRLTYADSSTGHLGRNLKNLCDQNKNFGIKLHSYANTISQLFFPAAFVTELRAISGIESLIVTLVAATAMGLWMSTLLKN